MMAEENASGTSRSVLGDLTNRIGKRGVSGREKNGITSFDCNDRDLVKRIRAAPRPCTEINSLKGNIIRGISKIPNENRDPNVSRSSVDVDTDCIDSHCLKGKNVATGNLKVHGGDKDIKILDISGGCVVSRSVDELDVVDNDLVDNRVEIDHPEDDDLRRVDKIAGQDSVDANFMDLGGRRTVNSISTEADGCGQLDCLQENMILEMAEVVNENKFPSLEHSVDKYSVNLTKIGGGEFELGSSKVSDEENEPNLLDPGSGDAVQCINVEANDELGDSLHADTSRTVSETGGDCPHDGKDCNADEVNASPEGTQTDVSSYNNDLDDQNADNFVLSQSGSIDCTILPDSQESRVFGVDRAAKLKKVDECAHMNGGPDSIRACPCSFCTKAAYIWLDLHQQDIKARMSAIKKSQKEAIILAERSCRNMVTDKHGTESSSRVSKLESHLTYQWRSLFQHMADIWEEEGNKLEASLLPLAELREKCKTDLELLNTKLSDKP
ncbi:uncharacterized protein LOC105171186 [Sesamum indicum]|uniref:Uncharacterized protein LOC105171186 n=1 Tax=Sesamum indicum TaxID=4182 RepID=A0A6I9TUD5_SESIN|nr:uncharacterized protein LOC105171186 [Sesamum indicum]